MRGWRMGRGRWVARWLIAAGVLLLLVGSVLGWLAPRIATSVAMAATAHMPLAGSGLDVSGYLGADITALAVIIAVVIGFNATTLQIAGQTHSLMLVRAILRSLTPFLACWSLATGVALVYFLVPPVFVAQLWQMLCWFAAVVVLMVAYLWDLPWRLSGQYVGLWAIRGLRGEPLGRWESLDGFSALQTSVSGASNRGDIGTIRAIAWVLGRFLTGIVDVPGEAAQTYDRGRYRALKNLLSGCAQGAAQAPNSAAYYLGYIEAGVVLQAIAVGLAVDDREHDLFTGLLRGVKGAPERLNSLWTGLRHALCRPRERDEPYLMLFWRARRRWPSDDPRRALRVAEALAYFHLCCWRELGSAWSPEEANAEATQMLVDLYRDIVVHLGGAVVHLRRDAGDVLTDLPLLLLDKVHTAVLRSWPTAGADAHRVTVVNAYEARRKELLTRSGQRA